jgi:hypothetical protein
LMTAKTMRRRIPRTPTGTPKGTAGRTARNRPWRMCEILHCSGLHSKWNRYLPAPVPAASARRVSDGESIVADP